MLRVFVVMLIFFAGMFAGWIIRGVDTMPVENASPARLLPEKEAIPRNIHTLYAEGSLQEVLELSRGDIALILELIGPATSTRARTLLQIHMATYGESLYGLIRLAMMETKYGNYDSAIVMMEKADLLTITQEEEKFFFIRLHEISDAYERSLLAVENYGMLDEFYERITFAMPEQAHFFLKLALLRIRLGNYEAALAPLSQIENHPKFGEKARELIAQTEVDDLVGSLEVLPLKSNGNQFVVEAVIDGSYSINLLIDTGAAMTVLDESVLQAMGYNLVGQRQEFYSTANGVVEAPVVSIQQLALGDASMGPLSVGALSLSLPGNIDGLLGMNFLRHYEFHIDQDRRELHLKSER